MNSFHHFVCFSVLIFATAAAAGETNKQIVEDAHYLVIKEDIIPDVENTTQKVIRVNPLDLPAIREDKEKGEDSSLYKIQSLQPAVPRRYVNSNRMRKVRPQKLSTETPDAHMAIPRSFVEPKLEKPLPKQKHLKFFYDQPTLDGKKISKSMRVKYSPGAYPVYYTVAKVNGKFGKFPIKGFRTPSEFMKYLLRSKSHSIDLSQRYEV